MPALLMALLTFRRQTEAAVERAAKKNREFSNRHRKALTIIGKIIYWCVFIPLYIP